jgi:hypothetical protein
VEVAQEQKVHPAILADGAFDLHDLFAMSSVAAEREESVLKCLELTALDEGKILPIRLPSKGEAIRAGLARIIPERHDDPLCEPFGRKRLPVGEQVRG